ncbi:MAG TPA: hypothetical protein VD789_03810, partial [Thermomicrobiales bacterium]|nr:hypothetical protein [Thermomicrobiales bacterium]
MTLSDISPSPALDRYLSTIYGNQHAWVRRIGAVDAGGRARQVFESGGVLAVRTGSTGAIMLPTASADAIAALPGAFDWLRHTNSNEVLIWSATPQRHMDRWLSAHGAHESFTPRWMI